MWLFLVNDIKIFSCWFDKKKNMYGDFIVLYDSNYKYIYIDDC